MIDAQGNIVRDNSPSADSEEKSTNTPTNARLSCPSCLQSLLGGWSIQRSGTIDIFGFILDWRQFSTLMILSVLMLGFKLCKADNSYTHGGNMRCVCRSFIGGCFFSSSSLKIIELFLAACFLLLAILIYRGCCSQRWRTSVATSSSSNSTSGGRPTQRWGDRRGIRGISDLPCDPVVG